MKTTKQLMHALLVLLLTAASALNTQATGTEPGDSVTKANSFDVGMYMSPQWKINLRLANHQQKQITITVRKADNTVLYREHVKRGVHSYWRKFDFEGSEPGVHQFEINDGQQTIVRRVEIVDVPTIESQRYITYGQPGSL